jgi:hypothetical protein
LYFGLFVSPFVLLFAASVLFLNHAKVATDRWSSVAAFDRVQLPQGIESARGPDAVARAQALMSQLGVTGEVGFTRYLKTTQHFSFPVSRPGLEQLVDVDLTSRTATVSRRPTSALEAFGYLHKMPGPHNAAIRGNWAGTRIWRWFADGTVYLLLFISISGVYLWWALKAERRIGLTLLTGGAATLFILLYVIVR